MRAIVTVLLVSLAPLAYARGGKTEKPKVEAPKPYTPKGRRCQPGELRQELPGGKVLCTPKAK